MPTCLGRRPIPIGAENSEAPPQEAGKVAHSSPLQPTADHTPSRRCALAASRLPLFFRELPLLTRLPLAQPLLSTADPAGNSVLSSPLGVTVADSQPCSGMRGVSNYRVRLAPGSIPALADPCENYINIGMPNNTVQVCLG